MKKNLRTGLMKKYKYLKYSDIDASIIRKFYRHLGGQIAIRLSKTRVTPNQVTVFGSFLVIIASVLIIFQGYIYLVLAAIAIFISAVLDHADGSLARIKGQSSLFGEWLDYSTDIISTVILLVCMTLHTIFKTQNLIFVVIGLSIIISFQAEKILFISFKKIFNKSASKVIENEKKKHRIRTMLPFDGLFIFNCTIVFALINKIEWFMLFCAVYGWLFCAGIFVIFTIKAKKINKLKSEAEALGSNV